MMTNRKNHGFTLVEILIVVVILGILAAIVIPQFSQASLEARESSLKSNLQAMRGQIELYKIQHLENLPGAHADYDFEGALINDTELDGSIWAAGPAYGPYMRKVPVNPFSTADPATNLVRTDGAVAGADTDHWRFDSTTGEFSADDAGTCPDATTLHSDL